MRIAIDLDGVLINTISNFVEVYNDIYKNTKDFKPKTIEDINNWEFYEEWKLPETGMWYIFGIVKDEIMSIPLIDKTCSKYMRKLNKNHTVDVVTASEEEIRDKIVAKLKRHVMIQGVQYNELKIIGKVNGKEDLEYDWFLDDNPNLALKIKKQPNKTIFLFDQPWNRYINCNKIKNAYRVKSWKEFWQLTRLLK